MVHRLQWFGWQPGNLGWLSAALQFPGTLLFNINTFDALMVELDWLQQDLLIWAPDIIGSLLFLLSGYLAFVEVCRAYWRWQPGSLSWWIVFSNLCGCVAFMISALFAIVLPASASVDQMTTCVTFTGIGAVGFLIGSLLMFGEQSQ